MTNPHATSVPRPVPHLQLFDFLDPAEYASLLEHVRTRVDAMPASTVLVPETLTPKQDDAVRRSRVDPDVELVWPPFEERLLGLLPHLRRELGIARFPLGSIERQLTVHADGDFFSRHLDENFAGTDGARMITFVYYFNAEPRLFDGGQLRLSDTVDDADGTAHPAASYTEIEPVANSIVFFPATGYHEVLPVRALGEGPGAVRCTVNGWFRAGDLGRPLTPSVDPAVLSLLGARYVPRVSDHGFTVRPTPEPVQGLLTSLWELGHDDVRPEGSDRAYFPEGDPDLLPMGRFGDDILTHLIPMHQRWAGVELQPVAAYGMRIYREGQRVEMHIDRPATHVISSMMVVAQDVDAPWPLHLDVDDRRHELYVQPGQMLLYEGASCPHGHLVSFAGRSYVIALFHYCPVGWSHSVESIVHRGVTEGVIDVGGSVRAIPRADPRWRRA